jgi:hypothetical protein
VYAQEAAPHTKWAITINGDDVPADGRHIGLAWDRESDPFTPVVIFRRPAKPGDSPKGGGIHVVDQAAQIVPSFMHPDTFRTQYYPAYDTSQHAIPPGTQLGVWTVVASFDGDPAHPIIDTVERDGSYVYALVPAERGAANDTYESLEGDAVVTPPVEPRPPSLLHMRWFQGVVGVVGAGLLAGGIVIVMRRRRAGARTSGEAS